MKLRFMFALASVLLLLAVSSRSVLAQAEGDDEGNELELSAGIGYDSNPFLAPTNGYFDQKDLLVVNPVDNPGVYLPVLVKGLLRTKGAFETSYQLRGDFYPENETSNAEEYLARISPGFRFDVGKRRNRDGVFYLRPFLAYKKDIFFDRDTGLARERAGVDVGDRKTFTALGGEAELEYEATKNVTFLLEGILEQRDYEETAASSLDHDRVRLGGGLSFKLGRAARLGLGLAYQLREYDQRRARTLDGDSDNANPLLEYSYTILEGELRLRPTRVWTLNLGWVHTERDDEFLGYNDYTKDEFRIRASFGGERRKLRLEALYEEKDYDRAFIFNEPINPLTLAPNPVKFFETVELLARFEFGKGRLRFFLGAEHTDQESTDPRFEYKRTQTSAGTIWVF